MLSSMKMMMMMKKEVKFSLFDNCRFTTSTLLPHSLIALFLILPDSHSASLHNLGQNLFSNASVKDLLYLKQIEMA